MKENLLNADEINIILKEAKDSKYQESNLLHLGTNKTSIFRFSRVSGLVLVNGNDSTGREHIDKRHSLSSRIPYWNEQGKIGNPSKFNLALAPIQYLDIADQLFKPENINSNKNKRPELFDTYVGTARLVQFSETEYTLVVYKNTRIIHTMYVSSNKKPFNKKKILDLRQGWTNGTQYAKSCIEIFSIPYFDKSNIEKFKIIIRTDSFNRTDGWYIQVNEENGQPLLTTRIRVDKITSTVETPFRTSQLDFSSLSWIEKEIKEIIDGKFKF